MALKWWLFIVFLVDLFYVEWFLNRLEQLHAFAKWELDKSLHMLAKCLKNFVRKVYEFSLSPQNNF